MTEPRTATVTVDVNLDNLKTVGELKANVASQVINGLYFGEKKLGNCDELLSDIGIVNGSKIKNRPVITKLSTVSASSLERSSRRSVKQMFLGSVSPKCLILMIYYIVTLFRFSFKKHVNRSVGLISNGVRPVLGNILAQLDVLSIVRLSSTCQDLRYFCFRTTQGIRISFPCSVIMDERGIRVKWLHKGTGFRTLSSLMLKNIQKFPVFFRIKLVLKRVGSVRDLERVKNFIAMNFATTMFSIISLIIKDSPRSSASSFVTNWDEIFFVLQTYNVEKFSYNGRLLWFRGHMEQFCSLPSLMKLELWGRIPQNLMIVMKQVELEISESSLSILEFQTLVNRMVNGEFNHIVRWTFNEIHGNLTPEAFRAAFEGIRLISFDDVLPEMRPLIYWISEEYALLLNKDDVLMDVIYRDAIIFFGVVGRNPEPGEDSVPFPHQTLDWNFAAYYRDPYRSFPAGLRPFVCKT